MGNLLERSREDEVEEESINQSTGHYSHHGYLYPPRAGCYFAGHFIMGGERFETCQPEAYLFGDNMDLNFLGPKPVPFPYTAPLPDEPTRSLRALVNIRKETLRLIKIGTTETVNKPGIVTPSATAPGQLNHHEICNIVPAPIINSINSYNDHSHQHHQSQLSNGLKSTVTSPSSPSTSTPTTTSSSSSTSSPKSSSTSPTSSSASLSSAQHPTQLTKQQQKPHQNNCHQHQINNDSNQITTIPTSSTGEPLYTIEFTFDSDVQCSITIYYLCLEETTPAGLVYTPRDPSYKSLTFYYSSGANQLFSQPNSLIFNPSAFNEDDLLYRAFDEYGNFDPTVPFPVVIQINAEEGHEPRQSHSLIATVERNNEKIFHIKPFKQKIIIDGLAYLIQEVYGIENKNLPTKPGSKPSYFSSDEEIEDNGSECVICMSESRDTLILPCRHLCLCNACADSLRYQANNCPICRSPFRALLQFRAVRKCPPNGTTNSLPITTTTSSTAANNNTSSSSASFHRRLSSSPSESKNSHPSSTARQQATATATVDIDLKIDTPPGYESISLIEALNGPLLSSSASRPRDSSHHHPFGMYGFQGSFDDDEDGEDDDDVEDDDYDDDGSASRRRLGGSHHKPSSNNGLGSRSLLMSQEENVRKSKESLINKQSSRGTKSSCSSFSDARYSSINPQSESSPRINYRSKSNSKSKLYGAGGDFKGKFQRSSESLTVWSQQGSSEQSGAEDQEKVRLLSGETKESTTKRNSASTSAYNEPIRWRNRKRGSSLYDDSEIIALSPKNDDQKRESRRESLDNLNLNSLTLSSGSYPDLCLRDGLDEGRFMDETDIISVTTLDSVPNVMEDEASIGNFTVDRPCSVSRLEQTATGEARSHYARPRSSSNQHESNSRHYYGNYNSIDNNPNGTDYKQNNIGHQLVKLAESETTDDLDQSSSDDNN